MKSYTRIGLNERLIFVTSLLKIRNQSKNTLIKLQAIVALHHNFVLYRSNKNVFSIFNSLITDHICFEKANKSIGRMY